jgi:hypothetical protein
MNPPARFVRPLRYVAVENKSERSPALPLSQPHALSIYGTARVKTNRLYAVKQFRFDSRTACYNKHTDYLSNSNVDRRISAL